MAKPTIAYLKNELTRAVASVSILEAKLCEAERALEHMRASVENANAENVRLTRTLMDAEARALHAQKQLTNATNDFARTIAKAVSAIETLADKV